ncbi:MAG: serine/threonine protein kinase [Solobacterium sp.]|nr:serine/threonine protein kinase [Solobacterium sp.]
MAQILNDTYEILEFIGSGGMSTVFKARHMRLNIDVAIKSVRKSQTVNLLAEVNILTKLNHPNLVRVIDIFEDERLLYIVMDLVEGENLQSVINRVKVIPEFQLTEWFKTMADTLRYLHSRKPPIIYRDMKPSNIILQQDGTLKLIDFGIAREYKAAASSDTTYIGTNGFAAPEQYGLAQTDERTDIYSLGMTMYYLATGKSPLAPPYGYTPARQINPVLSEKMERILEKCIKDNPQDRYQNATELLLDLNDGIMPTGGFGYMTAGFTTGGLGMPQNPPTGTAGFIPGTTGFTTPGSLNPGTQPNPQPNVNQTPPPAKEPKSNKWMIWVAAAALVFAALLAGYFTIHIYTEPTCTEPSVCRICGRQLVPALGHSWEAATADRPETCSRCGATRGESSTTPSDEPSSALTDTVSITEFNPKASGIVIKWSAFPGAETYRIYRQAGSGNTDLIKETTETEFGDSGANQNGKRYTYWVTAVVSGKETDKSKSKTSIFLDCSEKIGVKDLENKTVRITWFPNTQADGYQIRLTKGTEVTIINANNIVETVSENDGKKRLYMILDTKDLKGTYTVEVRCYKMLRETHYSAWSEAKEMTVR